MTSATVIPAMSGAFLGVGDALPCAVDGGGIDEEADKDRPPVRTKPCRKCCRRSHGIICNGKCQQHSEDRPRCERGRNEGRTPGRLRVHRSRCSSLLASATAEADRFSDLTSEVHIRGLLIVGRYAEESVVGFVCFAETPDAADDPIVLLLIEADVNVQIHDGGEIRGGLKVQAIESMWMIFVSNFCPGNCAWAGLSASRYSSP